MVKAVDVLIPLRFLALLGHFFAGMLAMYAVVRAIFRLRSLFSCSSTLMPSGGVCCQDDNVIVALPYNYEQTAFDASIVSARASIYLLFAFLAVNAVCFFGGFNTFNIAHGLFRACFARKPCCLARSSLTLKASAL